MRHYYFIQRSAWKKCSYPPEIVTEIGRERPRLRLTRSWSTYAHRPVNLLVPNNRPNGRAVPIFRSIRILRNIYKILDTRNPNSRLDAIRWGLLLEFRKFSLKLSVYISITIWNKFDVKKIPIWSQIKLFTLVYRRSVFISTYCTLCTKSAYQRKNVSRQSTMPSLS